MKYNNIKSKIAARIPGINKIVAEQYQLRGVAEQQAAVINSLKKQNQEIRKKLENEIRKKTDPKLTQDYKFATNPLFQITEKDIEKSLSITKQKLNRVETANWFIPCFQHILFGGLYTIFRFIEKFSQEGVENRIIIYSDIDCDAESIRLQIKKNFPKLKNFSVISFNRKHQRVSTLPNSDIAFCTLWDSAYLLLKFNKTKRKYYFIQDYEPLFFPAGTISALVESTYRFGFKGIVNTEGLFRAVKSKHGIEGISFTPAVDPSVYYPSPDKKRNDKVKIFFYARPKKPRNAFDLGMSTIHKLINKYGDKIEVVTAGSEWDESQYDLKGKIKNLGLLKSIEEVAELYRTCDIGFDFMLTKHPSYQPFEFMASGMATVVNRNEDNLWLFEDGHNCLISEPSPAAMAAAIGRLIDDTDLREKISMNGYIHAKELSWSSELDKVWKKIKK